MSLSSDIALARNASNGRFNFAWAAGDVVFDATREHEVLSRLVEWRGQWWADTTGTHGSTLQQIQRSNASTKSDAEASVRQALAGMVKAGDIVIAQVVVTQSYQDKVSGRFQVAVFYDVPKSGLTNQKATVYV